MIFWDENLANSIPAFRPTSKRISSCNSVEKIQFGKVGLFKNNPGRIGGTAYWSDRRIQLTVSVHLIKSIEVAPGRTDQNK